MTLSEVYSLLEAAAPQDPGWPRHGWPLTGLLKPPAFEVAVGAVLIQNTSWNNVTRALEGLRRGGLDSPRSILEADPEALGLAIRSAGLFRQKAATLQRLAGFLLSAAHLPPPRADLLAIRGIGPETADVIRLHGFGQPELITDNYFRRLLSRLGLLPAGLTYEAARAAIRNLPADPDWLQVLHARAVAFGKAYCRQVPRCLACPLAGRCPRVGLGPRED